MKIQNEYTPNFGAKLISKPTAGKIIWPTDNCYCSEGVSFLEIEPQNANDIEALKSIAKNWYKNLFAINICRAACSIRNESKYYKNNKIYALSSQNDKFEHLEPDKILGVVHVNSYSNGDLFIEHILAKSYAPDIKKIPEYKGIGTAMLTALKGLTNKIFCFPTNEEYVKEFYYKNGFIEYPPHSNNFVWYKDAIENFYR